MYELESRRCSIFYRARIGEPVLVEDIAAAAAGLGDLENIVVGLDSKTLSI